MKLRSFIAKAFLFTLIGVGWGISAHAATCQSNVASGNWGTPGTWAGAGCVGTVPRSTDTVTILNGHTITLNVSSAVVSVTVNAGGQLVADSNNRVLTLNPPASGTAFSVTASTAFNPGNSTVIIATNVTPITVNSGTVTFNNLLINSTVTVASTYNFGSSSVTCLGTLTLMPHKTAAGIIALQVNMAAPMTVGSTTTIMGSVNAVSTFTTTANRHAFTTGHLNIANNGFLLGNGSLITVNASDARFTRTGTFVQGTSTVVFSGPTQTTLVGQTTFYSLRAITPNTTIYFTAGTTQHVTNMVDFENISLLSVTNNSTWYFRYAGSSQTVLGVYVKDSNANQGSTLFANEASVNGGNTRNWAFGNRLYWNAAGAANWNISTSWSYSSAGQSGAPVPRSTHTVIFDGAGGTNGQANVNVAVNIASLTISGYTGTLNTQGYAITVTSAATFMSGTLTLTTNTFSVGGDLTRANGVAFNTRASTITLTGSQNQTINFGTATIFNLHVNKTGGTATMASAIISTGNLTVAGGTLDTSGSNWAVTITSHVRITGGTFNLNGSTMSVVRNWTKNGGTFNAGTSTVTFLGGNAQTLISGGGSFNNFISSKSALTILTLSGGVGVNGSWTQVSGTLNTGNNYIAIANNVSLSSGIWNLGSSSVSVGGNFLRTSGAFVMGTSTFVFNGSGDQSITLGATSFFNLEINKIGGVATLGSAIISSGTLRLTNGTLDTSGTNYSITATSNVAITGGTFNLRASTISVARDWSKTGGTFSAGTSTVTFTGGNAQSLTSGGTDFFHLTINKSAGSVVLQDALGIDGIYTQTLGTVNTSSKAITAGGNWSRAVAATFTGTGSTVTFVSPTYSVLSGPTTFYALRALTPETTLYFTAGTTQHITNMLDLQDVYLRSTSNNATWYFRYAGSSQTLVDVDVKDSNANQGSTLYPDLVSNDSGNNRNWSFGFDQRYWVSPSNSNWNNTANWSRTSGGSGGASIPTSSHTVTFDGVLGANGDCLVDTDVNVATLTLSGYNGVFNTQGFDVTLSSFSQTSAIIQLGTSVFTVQGSFARTGGAFDAGTSTIIFTGGNTQTLTAGGTNFYHVISSKTAGTTLTLVGGVSANGNWTQVSGTLNTGNNYIAIANDVTLSSGIWSLGSSSVSVGGDFLRTSGSFVMGTSTFVFNGSGDQSITLGATSFFNLEINKSGGVATLGSAIISSGTLRLTNGTLDTSGTNYSITATSNVAITGGTFNLRASTISVARDWTKTGGTFSAGTSTVTFSGANAQTLTSGGTDFFNLIINKSAGTLTLQDALGIDGIYTQTLGTLNTSSRAIVVDGNWNRTGGTFTGTGSTVTFASPTRSYLTGQTTFYALRAITPNTTLYFTAGTTQHITNMLDLENVFLRSTTNNSFWHLRLAGSSQTIINVDVKDSNAGSGNMILPNASSTNSGNNKNWAFGDDRYWVSAAAANWNLSSSWSRASGGTSGASVPSSTHTVIFDGFNSWNGQANVNVVVSISSLTLSGYRGTLNTQGYDITVASAATFATGAITLTTNTFSLGGDLIRASGVAFNTGASTITLTGGLSQTINFGTATIFNLRVNKTAGTATMASAITSTGSLIIAGGTLDTSGSNWAVTITSHVIITGGTFNLNNSTMGIVRNWTATGGDVIPGGSTVTFTGANTQNLTTTGDNFMNVTINKSGGSVVLQDDLQIDGIFTHTLGTFNTNSQPITAGGNWSRAVAATFTGTGSTVTFVSPTYSVLSGPTTFYALRALTPETTLYFTAGTTQHITNMLDLQDIYLRSTSNNATWYFRYAGSSQTLVDVDVRDSNANQGSTLYPDLASNDSGNNRNWSFGFDQRYWISSVNSNWNNSANWSRTSGGTGGASVPTSTHTVTFDGVLGANGNCLVDATVNVATLTLSGYTGLFNTQSYDVTLSSFSQTSATVQLGTSVFTLQGSFARSGGAFDDGASTISFTGSNVQTLTPGGTSFFHVLINKSGGSLTLASTMTVSGSFTKSAGTFTTGASTITFNATNAQTISADGQTLTHIVFNGVSGSWSLLEPLTVSSNVSILNGTFSLGSSTMGISGDWLETTGSFDAGTSTVIFTGPANQSITSTADAFFNFQINKPVAGTVLLVDDLEVDGIFTQTTGTLNTSSRAIVVGGDWNRTGGTFTGTGSTVTFISPTLSVLSGQTTFYALRALTPDTTLYFTAGTTQHITNMLDFENVFLRSTTNNSFWHLRLAGSSQTIINVDVRDSNASSGLMILPNASSTNSGNNKNWAFGDDRYWVASAAANWNLASSWSRASGGTSGASVPSSTHTVIFDGFNANGQANVNVAVSISSLTISGYTAALNTQGFAVTVASAATFASGTLTLTTNTFSLGGDLTRANGVAFNAGASTITLTGGLAQTINFGTATIFNLHVNKTGGTATMASAITSTGSLIVAGGTLDTSGSNWAVTITSHVIITGGTFNLNASTMSVKRDWIINGGTFNAEFSTVSFLGGNTQTLTSGSGDFYHLVINKNAGTALNISGQLNIDANLTHTQGTINTQNNTLNIATSVFLNGGTFNLGTSTVTVGGDFNRTAGSFFVGASTFVFTGSLNQSIVIPGTTGFFNINIDKSAGTLTLGSALISTGSFTLSNGTFDTSASNWSLSVTSHVVITAGTLNLNNSTMSVARDWVNTSGNVVPGGSTVTFTGANTQNLTTTGDNFMNVTINKSAGSVVLQDDLDIDGIFTHTLGTFNTNSQPITAGGNWSHAAAATFTGTGSTVTFNSPTYSTLSGQTTFYALRALTPETTLYFTAGTTQHITNMLDLQDVYLRSVTNNATWYFRYAGSSQTIVDVDVKDSNANQGSTLYPDLASNDSGNNRNWSFGFDQRYWVSSVDSNWNNTANWSRTSGGSGGASVPTSTHTVTFDGVLGANGNCLVDATVNVATLTLSGYTGVLNTQSYDVTLSSFSQTSATVQLGTSVFTVQGSFARSGGNFDDGSSTISFTGSNVQTLTPGGTSFFNVVINKSGGSLTLASTMTVSGSFTKSAGTFTTGASTITFNATNAQTISADGQTFTHIVFNGIGGSWSALSPITVSSNVSILNGTFSLESSTMGVSGDWLETTGNFDAGTSTVIFTGPANQSITSTADAFFNFQINKPVAGTVLLVDDLEVDGIFTQTAGTLNTSSRAIVVAGDWNRTGGTFTGTGSTVTFISPTQSFLSGQTTFYALRAITPNTTLYFTAGTTQHITNMLDLENVFLRSTTNNSFWHPRLAGSSQTIINVDVRDSNASSGLMILPNASSTNSGNNKNWAFGDDRYWVASAAANWNLASSWSRASGGTSGASVPSSTHTVIFDGFNANGQANVNVAVSISSLTISGYTAALNTQGYAVTVASAATFASGALTLTTNTFSVGGDLTRANGVAFNAGASTITLTGGLSQTINFGTATIFNLHVNKTGGTATMASAITSTGSLIVAGGTLDTSGSNWAVTITSHVIITGGTFNLNASTMGVVRNWTATGGDLIPGGSTVTFTGANTQNITSAGDNFMNMIINKSAGSVVLQDDLQVDGIFTHTLGTFNTNSQAITAGGNWSRAVAATFTGTGSTVTFVSPTFSVLSGPTTFYALRALTPQTTLYFTAGTTQHVTNMVEFQNISLRSTADNATWYFRYAGSSQTLNSLLVRDSNANQGSILISDSDSIDLGNNRNWIFGGSNLRYWVSPGAANWNTPTSWSYTSGGASGAAVPASTDTVIFNGVVGTGQANVDVVLNISTLTLSGYSGTINSQGYNISVASAVTLNSGTLTLTTNTFSVGGDLLRASGMAFNAGASTLALTGLQNQSINLGTATLFNLHVNKSGGTATMASAITSTGSLIVAGGTLDTSGSNWSVTITSHIIITGGTFNLNNSTLSVARNWTNTGGTFNPGGSTVTFGGANTQTLTSGGSSFTNFISSKSAGTLTLQDSLDVDAHLTITSGTFNTNTQSVTVGGDWRFLAGTYNGTGSTVTFNSVTLATLSGQTTFYALRALTANTTLYFTAGTTQHITNMLEIQNISLRSTSNNATWYVRLAGSSQTLTNVYVQDSNATAGIHMQTFLPSRNDGNNWNWDFGPPRAVNTFSATQSTYGAAIDLSWTAPGEDESTGILINSTFTVQYTTDTVFATGNSWSPTAAQPAHVYRMDIATTNVTAGSQQGKTVTGLISGGTYYFRLWTQDVNSNTSDISVGATNWAQVTVLGIRLSTDTLNLSGTINLNTNLVISTGIVVTNTGNITETYEFSASTATPGTPWQIAAATDTDRFVLWSIISPTEPITTDFGTEDKLADSYTRCTSSIITNSGSTCVSVPVGETRTIWFKLGMPGLTTTGNAQQIRITGKATVPD